MHGLPNYLRDTLRFYKVHFYALATIVLPFIVSLGILEAALSIAPLGGVDPSLLLVVPATLAFPFYQVALILYMASAVTGERLGALQCIKLGAKFWQPILLLYLITMVAVFAGLLLLVIPGLIVSARTLFAQFYCVLDEMKPMEAFNESWRESKERQWMILAGFIIVSILCVIPVVIVEIVLETLNVWQPLVLLLSSTVAGLAYAPPLIFVFRVFASGQSDVGGESA